MIIFSAYHVCLNEQDLGISSGQLFLDSARQNEYTEPKIRNTSASALAAR